MGIVTKQASQNLFEVFSQFIIQEVPAEELRLRYELTTSAAV
jgi:hypothetical protein